MKTKYIQYFVAALLLFGAASCKKDNKINFPPTMAEFTTASGTYLVLDDPNSVFKIPVGLTNVSSTDRTVTFTVTSPTGATAGTQYNLVNNGTVTIPAGRSVDSIAIKGIFAGYPTGRKDTLTFTITGGDGAAFPGNSVYKLVLQKFCPITLADLMGLYKKTVETVGTGAPYGPYTTAVTAYENLTATTGTITVANLYDYGWDDIKFTVNWSTGTPVISLATQTGVGDGATLGYDGETVAVRAFAGQSGTLVMCDQKITLKLQLGITGLGWFGDLYTVNMAR